MAGITKKGDELMVDEGAFIIAVVVGAVIGQALWGILAFILFQINK